MDQAKELLAINMKIYRKKHGFSQEKLAEITDLSSQSISDIEGCRTWVSDKTLEKLAKALNIDIFKFFIPASNANEKNNEAVHYNRLLKLRAELKDDIDRRLDQFFIEERKFS